MPRDIFEAMTAQFITRLLIVSYFVAVSIGFIPGIDVARLASPFMSDTSALYLMRLVFLSLSGCVLFGIYPRPAALILALVVFWTSYLSFYSNGDIDGFWRDLALIGALLMTAKIGQSTTVIPDEDDWDDDAPAYTVASTPDFQDDFEIRRAG